VLHAEVRAAMRTPSSLEPTTDSRSAARLARGAAFVVTSRYHPAVFAASGAVPILGIPVDGYTDVKLRGALAVAGQDGVVSLPELVGGAGIARFESLWGERDAIRARGVERVAAARLAATGWWDRVAETVKP
jgi:polysaccharide pyruvyl transferase WcaK-like protein